MLGFLGWALTLGPIAFALLKKLIPWAVPKLGKFFGWGTAVGGGTLMGKAITTGGVAGGLFALVSRIWGWLKLFPGWLKKVFGPTGFLAFVYPVFRFFLYLAKAPVLLVISFVVSSFFPTILEKIFLVVGAVGLKIFLYIFKLGKVAFLNAMDDAGTNGGNALSQFRDTVLGSFDELPPCMIQVMGYCHLVESLGIIMVTITLLTVVSVVRIVYGRFVTGNSFGLG